MKNALVEVELACERIGFAAVYSSATSVADPAFVMKADAFAVAFQ